MPSVVLWREEAGELVEALAHQDRVRLICVLGPALCEPVSVFSGALDSVDIRCVPLYVCNECVDRFCRHRAENNELSAVVHKGVRDGGLVVSEGEEGKPGGRRGCLS